ncbi:MAG: hypothetical protein RR356_01955 [Bacteroidales bacterium]
MTLSPNKTFLGIGITVPSANLHLHSVQNLTASLSAMELAAPLSYANLFQMTNPATGTTHSDGFIIQQTDNAISINQKENANLFIGGIGGGFTIRPNGNISIGYSPAQYKLDIDGTTCVRKQLTVKGRSFIDSTLTVGTYLNTVTLGAAVGSGMLWGNGYIGFNAQRNNGAWNLLNDGANNGATVIWSNVQGELFIATVPTTGASNKTLTDQQMVNSIKLNLKSNGTLKAKEILVTLSNWPDYVFNKEYRLMTLKETEEYIQKNGHLPNVPSASEVEKEGIQLGEMNAILLQKIEELTLYVIELEKKMEKRKKGNEK